MAYKDTYIHGTQYNPFARDVFWKLHDEGYKFNIVEKDPIKGTYYLQDSPFGRQQIFNLAGGDYWTDNTLNIGGVNYHLRDNWSHEQTATIRALPIVGLIEYVKNLTGGRYKIEDRPIETESHHYYLMELKRSEPAVPPSTKTYPAHSLLFFNLTGDSGLMPTDKAVRRFEYALRWNDVPFPNIKKDTLQKFWGEWFGAELLADVVKDTMWETRIDELFLRNIPVFIVNRNNSCKKYYIPALDSHITVPDDERLKLEEQLLIGDPRVYIKQLFPYNNPNDNNPLLADILAKETCIFDVWGCFTIREDSFFGRNIPTIFIWMDKLYKKANGNSSKLQVLFRLVLLHELAHALMFTGKFHNDTWHKINEESLANAYALTKIKATTNENAYKYAKEIVLSQPSHYALGAYYAEKYDTKQIYDKMESWCKRKY